MARWLLNGGGGGSGSGVTDHGALTGLSDDDHPQYRDRAFHTGTQSVTSLSDLTEAVHDIVGSLVVAGSNVSTATDSAVGVVELATVGEATAGTDTSRAVTPAGVKAVGDTKVAAVTAGAKLWIGTQSAYDALGTKDATTVYVVS